MPSIPTVIAISFAFWLAVYVGWLVFSPAYREQQKTAWRRMGEPHGQYFVAYSMFAVIGAIWLYEVFQADHQFEFKDLIPLSVGVGGIVGLAIITRKRLRS